jgi:hypothetical protein
LVRGRGAAAGTPPGIVRRREEPRVEIAGWRRANHHSRRRRTRGKRRTLRRVRRMGRVGRVWRPDDTPGADRPEIASASDSASDSDPDSASATSSAAAAAASLEFRPDDPARASSARRSRPAASASPRGSAGTESRSRREPGVVRRRRPRRSRRSDADGARGGGGVADLSRGAVDGLAVVLAGGRRGRGGRRAAIFGHRRKVEVRRLGEDIVHRVVVVVGGDIHIPVSVPVSVSVSALVQVRLAHVVVSVRSCVTRVHFVRGFGLAGVLRRDATRLAARRFIFVGRAAGFVLMVVSVDARDAVRGSALAVGRVEVGARVVAVVAVDRLGVGVGVGVGVELGDDEGEVLAEGLGVDGVVFGVVRGGGEPARDELLREDRGRVRELLLVEEHGEDVEDVLGGVPRKKEPRLRERHGARRGSVARIQQSSAKRARRRERR